jgi:hypothetical protein
VELVVSHVIAVLKIVRRPRIVEKVLFDSVDDYRENGLYSRWHGLTGRPNH